MGWVWRLNLVSVLLVLRMGIEQRGLGLLVLGCECVCGVGAWMLDLLIE